MAIVVLDHNLDAPRDGGAGDLRRVIHLLKHVLAQLDSFAHLLKFGKVEVSFRLDFLELLDDVRRFLSLLIHFLRDWYEILLDEYFLTSRSMLASLLAVI